ncbi:MAG: hypothetical protein WEA09_03100 [Gemmatimonadota bacterium]
MPRLGVQAAILLLVLSTLAACASTGGAASSAGGRASAPVEGLVVFPDGSSFGVRGGGSTPLEREVPGAPETLWPELVDAFRDLGLPVGGADPELLTVTTPTMTDTRNFQGDRMSRFMECGNEPGVVSVADAFRITWSVHTELEEMGPGRSIMRVELTAMASPPGGGLSPQRCRTTGELERRMASTLGERHLAMLTPAVAPPAAVVLPAAEPSSTRDVQLRRLTPVSSPYLVAGAVAGAAAGYFLGREYGRECETRCLNAKGTLGPMVGGTVLIPLGAHTANRGQGRYIHGFLASAGWAMLGAVVAGLSDETWPVWAVLPAQTLTSVYLEWHAVSQPNFRR